MFKRSPTPRNSDEQNTLIFSILKKQLPIKRRTKKDTLMDL